MKRGGADNVKSKNQKFRNLFEGYPRKYTRILQIFSQRISWHVECGRGEKTE